METKEEDTIRRTPLKIEVWHSENIKGKELGRKIADALNSDSDFTTDHILKNDKYIYDFIMDEKWKHLDE